MKRPRHTPRFVIAVYASKTQPETTFIVYAKDRDAALRVFATTGRDIRDIELDGYYDPDTNRIVDGGEPKSGVRTILSSQDARLVKSGE